MAVVEPHSEDNFKAERPKSDDDCADAEGEKPDDGDEPGCEDAGLWQAGTGEPVSGIAESRGGGIEGAIGGGQSG